MTATVLNSATVLQTFTACTVLASGCGLVTYGLNQTQSFISLDTTAKSISVQSTNVADIATHYFGLVASLVSYPSITLTLPFTVTILSCVVTSLTLNTGAFDPT